MPTLLALTIKMSGLAWIDCPSAFEQSAESC
jgi:hypothetical protein